MKLIKRCITIVIITLIILLHSYPNRFSAASNGVSNHSRISHQGILITAPLQKLIIKPHSKSSENLTLTLQNKNLYNGEYENGYLVYGNESLYASNSKYYKTTQWFPVLATQGQSLVLSGTAHNRSTWQFKTANGTILTKAGTPKDYKIASDVLQDKTVSKIDIPKDAVSARVYFANLKDATAGLLDDRLQIEYGKIPTDYQAYQSKQISLPKLDAGAFITYENHQWSHVFQGDSKNLDLDTPYIQVSDILTVSPAESYTLQASFQEVPDNVKYSGVYGVRWNRNDSNPICERVGDAKGLHFNAVVGSTTGKVKGNTCLTPYRNDFDMIYPWSDIRICAIKIRSDGTRNITYSNSKAFALDGSVGNIMVEIPKFYCKREVINNYEYLWISATEQKGFSLDPSFVTSQGVLDSIYLGAYLSSVEDNKLVSTSGSHPLINKSLNNLRAYLDGSKGFTECDLLAILTIQKLYLIETAILDSQSVFSGNVNLPYLLKDKSTSYYAVKSEKASNCIIVSKTKMTQKFKVGDAVSILGSWKEYKNEPEIYQRIITFINDIGNNTLKIEFTGSPVDIVKGDTGITCLPNKNGETDSFVYLTGSVDASNGHSSFKYRGLENLWGNVSILLTNAYVKNSYLYIKYPTGTTVRISYPLPVQRVQLSPKQFGSPTNMIAKEMGYDKDNPLIMLPSRIGTGATTFGYYCDSWYNLAEPNVSYILTYGGAWDNKGYAGIFNFRATFTETSTVPFNGSRIMLR